MAPPGKPYLRCYMLMFIYMYVSFRASQMTQWVKNPLQCRRQKRHEFHPWVWKISWRTAWQPTPVFFPGESHRQRSLTGYSPPGYKELDTTEQLSAQAHLYVSHVYIHYASHTHSMTLPSDLLAPYVPPYFFSTLYLKRSPKTYC